MIYCRWLLFSWIQSCTLIRPLCITLLKVPVINPLISACISFLSCCNVFGLFIYIYIYIYIYIFLLNNPTKRSRVDKVGEWGEHLDSEFLEIILPSFDRPIGLVVECSPMARETGVQSQVESYQRLKKWYLIPPCLTLSIITYVSRIKWSNPGKEV